MTEPPAALPHLAAPGPEPIPGAAPVAEAGLARLMLDTMRHGLALFDAEGRLVIANRLASVIAGLDAAMLHRGVHIGTLVRAQAERGELGRGEDAAGFVSRALTLDRSQPSSLTRRRPDGTVVEVTSTPAPGGGFVITFSDVTARAEAEAALRDQAGMLRATLDNLRHGVLVFGPDARLRIANALTSDLSGLPPSALRPGRSHAELVGELMASAELTTAEDRATALAALTTERSRSSGYTHTRPDGRIIEVRSDPTPDGGFIITHVEVTRQAQAEAVARRHAAQMQAMQDHMRHGIAQYGPDRRLMTMNRLAGLLSGVPEDFPLFGARFEDVVDAQASRGLFGAGADAAAQVARIKALDRRQPTRYQRTTPDGTVIEVTSDPTPDGGFVLTFSDVTARARAEAAAAERAARLQTMQDTMRHGIAFFGADSRLVMANALAVELAGLEPGDGRLGMTVAELNAIRRRRGVFGSGDAEIRASGRDRRRPHQFRRTLRDGRVVESFSDPTPDGGFVMTWTDVTALAQAEAAAEDRAATLQAMIENMRTGVALFGADRRLIAANRLAEDLAGYAPGQLQPGRGFEELATTQAPGAVTGDVALDRDFRALAMEADRGRPLRYTRPASQGRVVEVASDPMPDGGFVITLSEITALARAEAEAKQQARIQAVMLGTIRHGIALYGPDHRLIAVNRLTTAISGTTEEHVRPGVRFADVVRHQAAMGGLGRDPEAEVARLLSLDRGQPQHYRREASDGRMIEVHSDPTPDGGFAITFSDITALVAAEAAAQSRAAMLQAALDTMRHGIMLFGPDRRLLAANALATEIGGLSPEELKPGILLDHQVRQQQRRGMYGPEPEGSATCARLIASDRSTHWRRTRQMPDGRVVEVFSDPTPEGGFVVSFTDITAQAMAEAEAKRRAATLQVTMDNVRHGIAMYGPDRRLVVANRLAGPRHGLPELHERPGVLFEDLVCEQRVLGFFGPDPDAARIAAEVIGLDRTRPIRYQRRLPDGRMLDIGSDPTPDGGFVVTHTDVTDLEAAKAEASTRASVLQVMLDNLRHGIRYFGPDHRLIAFNTLVDDLTENVPLVVKVGVSFDELLQRQAAQGSFGDAEATAAALRLGRTLCRGEPVRYVRRTPRGRILEVSSSPTPNGGFIVIHSDVTELLEAQSAAADRAALLQLMLDSMRHGIALFDRDHRLVTANALTATFNGVAAAVLAPGRMMAEIAADVVAVGAFPAEVMRAAVEEDYSRPLRRSRQSADGRVIEVNADPTPDGGFVATYSDVTALSRAEASARTRADILQVMLDNIRHGICYYGPDRRVIAANALAAEFGGHAPGDLRPGRSLDALIEEQLALGTVGGDAQAVGRMAREMDRSRPARYVRQSADGRVLEITSDPTPDGGFVVTAADITALVDAEQALRHRAGILQAMLDNSRQGIVLFDAGGLVLAANGIAAALNGLPPEALRPGRHIQALIADQSAAGFLDTAVLAEALTLVPNDRPWPVPYTRRQLLPGGRVIEVTTDRAGDAGYIRSYRDISDEQRARGELERARDAAEAANKAKSRFLATMSHELRTPLNAVIGFSEAFMVDRDPVRGREYVQSIHEAGRHLLSLIDDILDVTRSETTGFAIIEGRVDIGGVAEGVVRVMQATAATAGVRIQAQLPPILPLVRADELRLRQVLLNLVANAVKFTPGGGSVTLGAVVEPVGDLVMRVTDTGIGMAPADIPRAFEAFTQLDSSLSRRFPGSGLGLYLSRALAEAQGATLTLESAPGAGTTAVLRIPKARLLAD